VLSFRRWWLFCGVVLVGVVAPNGGVGLSGLVSVAAPQPGASCNVVGRERVTGAGTMRCMAARRGGLRWRVVAKPVATTTSATTTTTTTTTSTTSTTSVRAVSTPPRIVSSSVSSDGKDLDVTIADMSPDTGVYAVQWVFSGDDFNAPTTMRVASKTFSIPYLWCARSYTLRVFGMNAGWQTSDGFTNQNVTSTSAVFEATMPRCIASAAATTTTVALTCAQGGTCAVGNTGPGGGVVFYVAGSNFTSTGSDCNTACKYLEAAPADQSAGIVWATTAAKCYANGSNSETGNCQANSIYSDTAGQAASRTAATAIGMGMANTNQIYARLTTAGSAETTTYAAGIAWAYSNGGKTDWHLPSKDELNELCKYAKNTGQAAGAATVCSGGSVATDRGFASARYWSSSEGSEWTAWRQHFDTTNQIIDNKAFTFRVRPVRAFG